MHAHIRTQARAMHARVRRSKQHIKAVAQLRAVLEQEEGEEGAALLSALNERTAPQEAGPGRDRAGKRSKKNKRRQAGARAGQRWVAGACGALPSAGGCCEGRRPVTAWGALWGALEWLPPQPARQHGTLACVHPSLGLLNLRCCARPARARRLDDDAASGEEEGDEQQQGGGRGQQEQQGAGAEGGSGETGEGGEGEEDEDAMLARMIASQAHVGGGAPARAGAEAAGRPDAGDDESYEMVDADALSGSRSEEGGSGGGAGVEGDGGGSVSGEEGEDGEGGGGNEEDEEAMLARLVQGKAAASHAAQQPQEQYARGAPKGGRQGAAGGGGAGAGGADGAVASTSAAAKAGGAGGKQQQQGGPPGRRDKQGKREKQGAGASAGEGGGQGGGEGGESSEDEAGSRAHTKRALRKAKAAKAKGEAAVAANPLACKVCGVVFPSKTQLFKHVRDTGHAAPRA